MWLIVAIVVILLVIALYLVGKYNHLVRLNNDCNEAVATMDVFLKKRYDLIPNLVETVKGYAAHEQETLERVVEARTNGEKAESIKDREAADTETREAVRSIFALSESYPELHANANFLELQGDLRALEQDIANARKYYNGVVKIYNNTCQMFPGNIVSSMFKFPIKPMFETVEEARENVEVDF